MYLVLYYISTFLYLEMIIELPDPSFDLRHTVSTIEDGDTEPKKEKQDEHFPLTSPLTVCVCVCVCVCVVHSHG